MAAPATSQPSSPANQQHITDFPPLSHLSLSNTIDPSLPITPTNLHVEVSDRETTPLKNQYVNVLRGYTTTIQVNSTIEPIPIKKLCYNNGDRYSYLMRPFIYGANFSVDEETMLAMAWISFQNLKPTYFVKESIFSLGVAVQIDLLSTFTKFVKLEVVNENTQTFRIEQVKIQYDFLLKYYKECKLQNHNNVGCRILHLELRRSHSENDKENLEDEEDSKNLGEGPVIRMVKHLKKRHPTSNMFSREDNMEKRKGHGKSVITEKSFAAWKDRII
ncbi:hypothetical protein H5410_014546 [Solanum commersonii]|uniref:DUF4283 domain-containing protein n=1 Tax=Solanum commersonii TaxID=4109 RepID=A0A9J5ZRP5_SOLCO|nr:hypothetical protein H5410_014546 [Solanum commersonii]